MCVPRTLAAEVSRQPKVSFGYRRAILTAVLFLLVITSPAQAGESHHFAATHGLRASFYVIGGQYTIYIYAKRPVLGSYAPESRECIFGGNFQRIWPTHDDVSLGSGIVITTIVPHKIGPKPITLTAGLYALYIPALTTCDWKFSLVSTNENLAGVAPVTMLKRTSANNSMDPAASASITEPVRFYAQFRTDHDKTANVSGEAQFVHDRKIVSSLPLSSGMDENGASFVAVDVTWKPETAQYLGASTVKFVVRIGGAEYTATGEFTLTR
jgi:hypothetical protein